MMPYEYMERVAICTEAGVIEPRAREIAGQQPISYAQLQQIHIAKNKAKLNDGEFRQVIGRWGYASSKDITMGEFAAVMAAVGGHDL